jgi:uncharacterized protein (TIGR03067 family)
MRLNVTLLIVAYVSVPGICGADDVEPKGDLADLQGEWVIVGKEWMGKKATKEEIAKLAGETVFKDRTLTVMVDDGGEKKMASKAKFKIDPKAKPKALDLEYVSGPQLGKCLAIYELKEGKLKICFAMDDGGRPTEFAGKVDGKSLLLTYERMKKKK